jgi:hypothetical protein
MKFEVKTFQISPNMFKKLSRAWFEFWKGLLSRFKDQSSVKKKKKRKRKKEKINKWIYFKKRKRERREKGGGGGLGSLWNKQEKKKGQSNFVGADQKKTLSTWTAQNFENLWAALKFIQAIYRVNWTR